MRRPAILTLGLLAISVILAGRWLSRSTPIAANGAAPAPEAPQEVGGENFGMAVALAPVDPERSPAPVAAQGPSVAPANLEPTPEVRTIQGRVVSDNGDPLEGARVEAVIQSDADVEAPTPEAVTDRQGTFTLEGCAHQGEYELTAKLDGWWQVAQIVRPTGATDVELVLQRGGGIRGQVIEALDSTVEDYIVVARYENPPVEWTPERRTSLERALQRDFRRQTRLESFDQMQIQMLQDHGTESKPDQRPNGEAWTFLDQDGRFELSNVRPGKSSVLVAARNRTRGLATIAGVEVLPGIVTEDARVNPVNMNGHACVYEVAVTDPNGVAVPQGTLEVLPVEKDAHGRFTVEFKEGAATFIGPLWIDQVTVTAEGFQPLVLRGPKQSIRATLQSQ